MSEIREINGALEVLDAHVSTWVVRFEPLDEAGHTKPPPAAALAVAAGLVEALPGLSEALRARGAMRVVFSAEVRKALVDGTYRLMGSGDLPMAIDSAGRVVEIAKVQAGALAASGAGAGTALGLGALASVSWPVVVAAGVATAAAMAQQRWLERAFSGLESQLDHIETRLRDDDLGNLDATDRLVDLLAELGFAAIPQQLRAELAVSRRTIDAIYFSRRRFVERLKRTIEQEQNAYEQKTGERKAWAGDVVKQIGNGVAADELVVFLRAMIARARLSAVTAGLLSNDGTPVAALHLLDEVHDSLRSDYWDLQNRLAALARSTPESPLWRRLVDRKDSELAIAHAKSLSDALVSTVGARLPDRDEPLVLGVLPPQDRDKPYFAGVKQEDGM